MRKCEFFVATRRCDYTFIIIIVSYFHTIDCTHNKYVYMYKAFGWVFFHTEFKPNFLQALIDIAASEGWLGVTLTTMHLVQMCVQGRWLSDPSLLTLPHFDSSHVHHLNDSLAKSQLTKECGVLEVASLAELLFICEQDGRFLNHSLGRSLSSQQLTQVKKKQTFEHGSQCFAYFCSYSNSPMFQWILSMLVHMSMELIFYAGSKCCVKVADCVCEMCSQSTLF